jgi:hypothetical protein
MNPSKLPALVSDVAPKVAVPESSPVMMDDPSASAETLLPESPFAPAACVAHVNEAPAAPEAAAFRQEEGGCRE